MSSRFALVRLTRRTDHVEDRRRWYLQLFADIPGFNIGFGVPGMAFSAIAMAGDDSREKTSYGSSLFPK